MTDPMPQFKPENNIKLWLMLYLTPKVSNATILKLLKHFGSIENIFEQNLTTLASIINPTIAKLIVNQVSATEIEQILNWQTQPNHYIISLVNPLYPKELLQLTDAPIVLFLQGNINLLSKPKFALIGIRTPSHYAKENSLRLAQELSARNITIVAGIATATDKHVHLGTSEQIGASIGIVNTNLSNEDDSEANKLIKAILLNNGLIISEYPLTKNFIVNSYNNSNRLIVALCLGVLVLEAAIDSEALLLSNLALDLGREVMAIPGLISHTNSRGCHKLIKNGAKLVETSLDIIEDLRLAPEKILYNSALNDENLILSIMGDFPVSIEQINTQLHLDLSELYAKILELELSGMIVNCGNGKYQRKM
jgi:DNA processing protein